jgi:flagellar basal-body rod protein FlgC
MTDFTSALAISSSGMQAQSHRLRLVSENIANADTPGYRAKSAPFETALRGPLGDQTPGAVNVGDVRLDQTELERIYDPAHPLADDSGHFDGSNVDLMIQIADAREAQRSYEANLRMFDQARQMSSSLMDLLRR